MALSPRKRRQRDLSIVITLVLLIAAAVVGRGLVQDLFRPDLAGYAKTAPAGDFAALAWDALGQGTWQLHQPPVVPAAVTEFDGKPIVLKGFMLPFHTSGPADEFWIAGKPRGCYYCNPPGVAEVVHVKVAGGQKIEATDYPVRVFGVLKVARVGDEESLYTLDDAVLTLH